MARYDAEEALDDGPNDAVTPALVNPPVIFLAPAARTVSSGELWIAVSCNDANYGGCVVQVSNDNAYYEPIGKIYGNATHGVLTAALPAASGLDITNTLAVDIAASRQTLQGYDQQTFDVWDSLCYVGGELVAYRDFAMTGAGTYTLSHLQRGLYGSTPGAALGAAFVFNTKNLFRYRFNKNAVGKTLYFKFQGFNVFETELQDLAVCVAYSFAVSGDGGVKALLSDLEKIIRYLVPVNISVLGTMPKFITSLKLPAGIYSNISATLGASTLTNTATLTLKKQDGTVLKTLAHTGVPATVNTTGFSLAQETQIDLTVECDNINGTAYFYGAEIKT